MGYFTFQSRAHDSVKVTGQVRPTGASAGQEFNVNNLRMDSSGTTLANLMSLLIYPVDDNRQFDYTMSFLDAGGSWAVLNIETTGWWDDRGRNA